MSVKKIVILFSGVGTNLQNIINKLHKKKIHSVTYEVAGAICNKKEAKGINICKKYNIPFILIEHKAYNSREEFDKELVQQIQKFNPDITVLAGFMRILTPIFTKNIKAINLHPSILPLFKGENAIQRSFESDMKVGGVSVHFVSDELDGGSIILQECFQKEENQTLQSFQNKIKQLEFELLPKAIIKILKDKQCKRMKQK